MKLSEVFFLMISLLSAACSGNEDAVRDDSETSATSTQQFTVDTLHTQFANPWGMTWLPDGRMLVVERRGEILVFENDRYTGTKLTGVPQTREVNQAGMLDIALHPDYENTGWIYLAYSRPEGEGDVLVISRAKLAGNQLHSVEEIFVNGPAWKGGRHFGCRIIFDKDGFLYFSNGDKGSRPENAQELDNDHGKIHRLHDDGRIPADNPFVNTPGAQPSIWTYGNRNPQGMVYDVQHDRIWSVEHGPRGGDELNLIEKGKNYGWPEISYGINYDGTVLTPYTEKEGMEQPVTYWVPSIAVCGMALVTSDRYPAWRGHLLVAALAGQHIAHVALEGTQYVGEEKLLEGIGRVRQVAQSPDGFIYALTEGTGLLIKLIPQDS